MRYDKEVMRTATYIQRIKELDIEFRQTRNVVEISKKHMSVIRELRAEIDMDNCVTPLTTRPFIAVACL